MRRPWESTGRDGRETDTVPSPPREGEGSPARRRRRGQADTPGATGKPPPPGRRGRSPPARAPTTGFRAGTGGTPELPRGTGRGRRARAAAPAPDLPFRG